MASKLAEELRGNCTSINVVTWCWYEGRQKKFPDLLLEINDLDLDILQQQVCIQGVQGLADPGLPSNGWFFLEKINLIVPEPSWAIG